jgi:hypothetical protein
MRGNGIARYQFIVLTCAKPGREADFRRWYEEQHLPDVVKVDGIVSGQLFDIGYQGDVDIGAPAWNTLAIYEIETDGDPANVVAHLTSLSGTDAMPMTDAFQRPGLLRLIGSAAGPKLSK